VAAPTPQMLLARHNFELLTIREALNGLRVKASLEVGCGFGRLSMAFADHSARHVGVDINLDALTLARTVYPDIEFYEASVTALPFGDCEFGLVSTWTVLQHVPPDYIQNAADEITRVTSPMATLLLCEETRLAQQPVLANAHTWHRTVETYGTLFAHFSLIADSYIHRIDRVPGLTSPGRVMIFRRH
jgi:ubiquinone/menaquinone biosynthesis C-methylase UbiE